MTGHRIGYIRVSSFDQNPERQLEDIPVDRVFTDKASGKDAKRPELDALLSLVRPRVMGDVDFDNAATLADAVHTLRAVAALETFTPEQATRANVTGHEGDPTAADAAAILRLAGGLSR